MSFIEQSRASVLNAMGVWLGLQDLPEVARSLEVGMDGKCSEGNLWESMIGVRVVPSVKWYLKLCILSMWLLVFYWWLGSWYTV